MGRVVRRGHGWLTSERKRSLEEDYIKGKNRSKARRILCNDSHSIVTTKLLGLNRGQTFSDNLSSSMFSGGEYHINRCPCTKV